MRNADLALYRLRMGEGAEHCLVSSLCSTPRRGTPQLEVGRCAMHWARDEMCCIITRKVDARSEKRRQFRGAGALEPVPESWGSWPRKVSSRLAEEYPG